MYCVDVVKFTENAATGRKTAEMGIDGGTTQEHDKRRETNTRNKGEKRGSRSRKKSSKSTKFQENSRIQEFKNSRNDRGVVILNERTSLLTSECGHLPNRFLEIDLAIILGHVLTAVNAKHTHAPLVSETIE